MLERPEQFTINRNSSLSQGLVFAGLGGFGAAGSLIYPDASGFNNHGTLTNMDPPTDWMWVPELGRWGLDLDNSNDYVLLPGSSIVGPGNLTFAAWMKSTQTGNDEWIISEGGSTAFVGLCLGVGLVRGSVRNDASSTVNNQQVTAYLNDGNWHHLAMTINNGYLECFGDGQSTGAAVAIPSLPITLVNAAVGCLYRSTPSNYFGGSLADILKFNRALAPAEIQQLADPSNVLLSGLIQPPRRRLFAVSGGVTPPAFKAAWAIRRHQTIGSGVI